MLVVVIEGEEEEEVDRSDDGRTDGLIDKEEKSRVTTMMVAGLCRGRRPCAYVLCNGEYEGGPVIRRLPTRIVYLKYLSLI